MVKGRCGNLEFKLAWNPIHRTQQLTVVKLHFPAHYSISSNLVSCLNLPDIDIQVVFFFCSWQQLNSTFLGSFVIWVIVKDLPNCLLNWSTQFNAWESVYHLFINIRFSFLLKSIQKSQYSIRKSFSFTR